MSTNNLRLAQISVSSMDNNCYLLIAGDKALLIDAADNAPALLNLAKENGATISHVLTTHRHADHVGALEEVLEATGATHLASFLDSPALPCPVDIELEQGGVVEFEGYSFPVSILRGHTPGGVMLEAEVDGEIHLFVGDSLFPGGLGKTTYEGEFGRLFKDVTERIFDRYPDSAIVHPGHGKPTTLGAERPHLEEWRERGW